MKLKVDGDHFGIVEFLLNFLGYPQLMYHFIDLHMYKYYVHTLAHMRLLLL